MVLAVFVGYIKGYSAGRTFEKERTMENAMQVAIFYIAECVKYGQVLERVKEWETTTCFARLLRAVSAIQNSLHTLSNEEFRQEYEKAYLWLNDFCDYVLIEGIECGPLIVEKLSSKMTILEDCRQNSLIETIAALERKLE